MEEQQGERERELPDVERKHALVVCSHTQGEAIAPVDIFCHVI